MQPVNKQSALFLSRKRTVETMQEAIDGSIAHLSDGKFLDAASRIFSTAEFGPEPELVYSISIRRDVASSGKFVYSAKTTVSHEVGAGVKFYHLK